MHLPGQVLLAQDWFSLAPPSHPRPPPEGIGLAHARMRSIEPPPQVALQIVQSVQFVQPPSTDRSGCIMMPL